MAVRRHERDQHGVIRRQRRGTPDIRPRCLRFETLEDRHMLAMIVVTSLADDLTVNGQVTLREAIRAAELNISVDGSAAGSGADIIEFHPSLSGSVNLSVLGEAAAGPSALSITSPITIRGNAEGITIARDATAPEMRLIRVAASGTLKLESLMLTGGVARGAVGTALQPNGGDGRGGAVLNEGTLEVTASTLYGNQAHGGAAFDGGVGGAGRGGAIASVGGVVTIRNSTLSANAAYNSEGGSLSAAFGGGIHSQSGDLSIRHATIMDHTAVAGRGVYFLADDPAQTVEFELFNSIVGYDGPIETEYTDVVVADDNGGMVASSAGFNLIRRSNDVVNGNVSNAAPMLGPLADNGGPTWTRAILAGSPAVDAGDPMASAGIGGVPPFDQRGAAFARVVDGDGAGGAIIDIGALELEGIAPPPLTGDYNNDGSVNAADYTVWRDQLGGTVTPYSSADGDGTGTIDTGDYAMWKSSFGAISAVASAGQLNVAENHFLEAATDILAAPALLWIDWHGDSDLARGSSHVQVSPQTSLHGLQSQDEVLISLLERSANAIVGAVDPTGLRTPLVVESESEIEQRLIDVLWGDWMPNFDPF